MDEEKPKKEKKPRPTKSEKSRWFKKTAEQKAAAKAAIYRSRGQLVVPEPFKEYVTKDARALVNVLPEKLRRAIDRLPDDLLTKSEDELHQLNFALESADSTSNKLRISFWDEYERVLREKEMMMEIERVVKGICSISYFERIFCSNVNRLAWLIHAPSEYKMDLRDLHSLGIKALRKIMTLPPTNPDGSPNTKLIEAQNKIFQHVDMRIEGAIIQRIDQRNVNVNLTGKPEEAVPQKGPLTMHEIDAKLKQLEKQSIALSAPAIINVDLMKETEPDIIDVGEINSDTDRN